MIIIFLVTVGTLITGKMCDEWKPEFFKFYSRMVLVEGLLEFLFIFGWIFAIALGLLS